MKRILILGGSHFQIPFIERAKANGLYVITCDYLPDNPGHALAHEYHDVSTTDREAVAALARRLAVDAVATFASDPSVPAVAHTCDLLGLPGPTYAAILALTDKDRFRELMRRSGLNVPEFATVTGTEPLEGFRDAAAYIVKPVDSSGSKGVTRSTGTIGRLSAAVEYAMRFSRAKRCIIEEYIDGPQIHGDGFLVGGKLVNHYLGDQFFFTTTNSFIPISTRWPSRFPQSVIDEVVRQVEVIASSSGYLVGPVNIEARVNGAMDVYVIEVGPRNGGNYVPVIQQRLTGFDYVDAALRLALGEPLDVRPGSSRSIGAQFILHADRAGTFAEVVIDPALQDHVFYTKRFLELGDPVSEYRGSNAVVGVLLLEFSDAPERDRIMSQADELIRVIVT